MIYPPDMDRECVALCDAINAIPGLRTTESCCGHGRSQFLVIFDADSLNAINPILKACAMSPLWEVKVAWATGSDTRYFVLRRDACGLACGDEFALVIREQIP